MTFTIYIYIYALFVMDINLKLVLSSFKNKGYMNEDKYNLNQIIEIYTITNIYLNYLFLVK